MARKARKLLEKIVQKSEDDEKVIKELISMMDEEIGVKYASLHQLESLTRLSSLVSLLVMKLLQEKSDQVGNLSQC